MEKAPASKLGITNLFSGLTVACLILLPAIVAAWPTVLAKMRDDYPERIKNADALYMLLSPTLDRRGIHAGTPPKKIMENSMKVGLRKMVDRIVKPVTTPVEKVQDVIANTLDSIKNAIQKGISLPMRSLYIMGSHLTDALNKSFGAFAKGTVGVLQGIQGALNAVIAGTIVGLNIQTTIYNLAISGIKFFLWVVEAAGIAVTAAGALMMFSIFTIIPGIILEVLGGILTGIAANSESVFRYA